MSNEGFYRSEKAASRQRLASHDGGGAGKLGADTTIDEVARERKALQAKLARSKEKLELALQGHTVGIWDWPDMSQDYINISEELRLFMGYQKQDIENSMEWIFSIIHPEDIAGVNSDIAAVLHKGGKYLSEFRIRFPGKGYRWVRSAGVITRNAGGDGVHRLTGALSDVHDRRMAEQSLQAANTQLQQFSYVVAHDLAAPLRHIENFSIIIKEEYGNVLDEEGLSFIDTIIESSHRADAMIKDLLEYAKTGTSSIEMTDVDLQETIAEVKAELIGGGGAQHVSWSIAELPVVQADPQQMRLLFQNLLSNAVKYTSATEEAVVKVTARTEEVYHIISVQDNGAGFEQSFSQKMFKAFERGANTAHIDGTGIGLAQVARIVARHQGQVSATGKIGEGATFEVALPMG